MDMEQLTILFWSARRAYDDIIQGQSGLAGLYIEKKGKPEFVPSVIADKSIGLIASTGLLAKVTFEFN